MNIKQECIPVGCVPSAAVIGGGGGLGPDPPEFPPWMLAWTWSHWISPLGVGLDLIPLNFPLGCGPGSDPPVFPLGCGHGSDPPSISPLGVDLDLIPLNFPLGCGPGPDPLNFPLGCGPGGGSPWQGVSLVGVYLAGGSQHALRQTPLLTEWQTGAKILPCPKSHLRAVINWTGGVPSGPLDLPIPLMHVNAWN